MMRVSFQSFFFFLQPTAREMGGINFTAAAAGAINYALALAGALAGARGVRSMQHVQHATDF